LSSKRRRLVVKAQGFEPNIEPHLLGNIFIFDRARPIVAEVTDKLVKLSSSLLKAWESGCACVVRCVFLGRLSPMDGQSFLSSRLKILASSVDRAAFWDWQ
jgi:hypothetical protein